MASHIVGYPRMGLTRELKFALESFWDGKSTAEDLQKVSADLRSAIWQLMSEAGIKYIPSNTFSYYDQVFDTTAMLGAVPPRYGYISDEVGFDVYFSMARGNASVPAMEMTNLFDTKYQYIVPELGPEVKFSYASHKAVNEYKEAKALGVDTVPVLVGPVSYLLLSKAAKGVDKSFDLLSLLPKILPVYKEVITELKAAGATWIQLDEPVLVMDLEVRKLQAFTGAYAELESTLSGLNVLVETYFADIPAEAYKTLTMLKGVTAFGFDLICGTKIFDLVKAGFPQGKYIFAGVVDGRNIRASDFSASLSILQALEGVVGKDKLVVSTSCSLLHTAVDLINETKLDAEIKSWMAFVAQKVVEVNALAKALAGQKDKTFFSAYATPMPSRRSSPRFTNEGVQKANSPGQRKTKMVSDRSEFRVQIRKLFVIMIRMFYRWIWNHPFLLGFVGILYFLHRCCPLLFFPLLSASPVLACTFVLLGIILSFGEPNIPEIEKEPEIVSEVALFGTQVSRDATVVEEGDKSFTVERFVSTGKDVLEDAEKLAENQLSGIEDDSSFDYKPLIDETLDEVKRDTHVRFEEKAFILDLDKRAERVQAELIEDGGKQVSDAEQSRKNGWKDSGSLDEMLDDSKEDNVDLSPVSPWRPMRHDDDEDDDADRDDSLDSESDGAESSSLDASMTDIIPMLDELHPLLLSGTPSRGLADAEGSDAASEGPHMSSSDEGMESDVDSESHGEEGNNENEEEDEDEDEDEDEEEKKEKKEDKEDESKSAIKWTEADQKNLMDLGTLELERNQRLENLIARRRARHNMRVMAERNLIDFDSADIPFNMPAISTARQNPFDLPYDPYDDMGLPPIPGSAPSLMFPRRNPFDLPYEPNEEKVDLKGDDFQEEFSSQQSKDPVFRRHESFSVGPSTLGGARHDRLRPFFVLERLAHEGTSYYPLERQLSEVSESKVSSVPDTESVCTILEDDEKKVEEHNADLETEIDKVDTVSDQDEEKSHSTSDVDVEQTHSSEDSDIDEQAKSRYIHHDVAEIVLGSPETHDEQSKVMEGETSDMRKFHDEDYSDNDSSLPEKDEKISDISDNETTSISEKKFDLHEESGISSQPSLEESQIHLARSVDNNYYQDEAPTEDSFFTAHPSHTESAFHDHSGLVDDHPLVEPVYDSSPLSRSRVPSFSSVSSDYKPEAEKNEEEVHENADKEREVHSESIGPAEIHSTSDEIKTNTKEVGGTSLHVDGQSNSTFSGSKFEDTKLGPSSLPLDKNETTDHHEDERLSVPSQEDLDELHEDVKGAVDTRTPDVDAYMEDIVSPTGEEVISAEMVEQHLPVEHAQSPLRYGNTSDHETTLEDLPNAVHDIAETSAHRSVAEGSIQEDEEAHEQNGEASPQSLNANIPIDNYSALSSGAVEYVETHSFNDDDVPQSEQDQVQPSVSDDEEGTYLNQSMDIQVDSINAVDQNVGSEDATPSASSRELTWSDKSVVEQSSLEDGEDQEPSRAGPVSVVFSRNITFHEYHDAPEDSDELSGLTYDTSPSPVDSPEYETPMVGEGSREEFFQEGVYGDFDHVEERLDQLTDFHAISESPQEVITEEADEIKEIDVGLLSELDTIGDFNVKEVVTDSEPGPSSVESDIANEQVEALPILEVRSVEDTESALQQIHEGPEVDDVTLESTAQDQFEENHGESETSSDLAVAEATSKKDLDYAMNQAAVDSLGKQPKSLESDGGSGESKSEVETEPSVSLVDEDRSLDEKSVRLNNTPEKEETNESGPKETVISVAPIIETQSLDEIPEPSDRREVSESVVIPTEDQSNVPAIDEVVTEKAKTETASDTDANVKSRESEETPQNSEESIGEEKRKEKKEEVKEG